MNNTESGGTENASPVPAENSPAAVVMAPTAEAAEKTAATPAKAPARVRAPARPKAATPAKKATVEAKPAPAPKTAKKAPAAPKAAKEAVKPEKKEKDKTEKVVRDSFSMPKSEHGAIKQLRTEIARAGRIVSKSEVLRAALKALASQGPAQIVGLIEALPVVPKGTVKKR